METDILGQVVSPLVLVQRVGAVVHQITTNKATGRTTRRLTRRLCFRIPLFRQWSWVASPPTKAGRTPLWQVAKFVLSVGGSVREVGWHDSAACAVEGLWGLRCWRGFTTAHVEHPPTSLFGLGGGSTPVKKKTLSGIALLWWRW